MPGLTLARIEMVKTAEIDDEGIASLVREGRLHEAIDAAARAHGVAVERVCTALCGRPALAADITQDTFVAAVQALTTWRKEGSVRAFLCGIARKLCAQERVRTARQQARLHLVHDTAAAPDSSEALETAQRARMAREALSCLGAEDQEILVLRYEGDLPYAEIAKLLSIDEPTARKRASRALLRMRRALPTEAP